MAPAEANVTTRSRDRATCPAARSARAAGQPGWTGLVGRSHRTDRADRAGAAHEWKVDVHPTPEMPDIQAGTFHSWWCVAAHHS